MKLHQVFWKVNIIQTMRPNRGGCWFCPNAKRKELRHLYDYHPNMWERMLELQALPNKVSEKFNRRETFSDIDAEFRLEDAQESLFQNAA